MNSVNNHPVGKLKNTVAFESPTVVIFFLALFTLIWGIWFLMPWDVFDSSPTFALMQRMWPEWIWGLVSLVLGGAKLLALWQYLKTDKVTKRQILFNFLMFVVWSTVTLSIGIENWHSTGVLTYGFISLVCIWTTAQRLNEYWFQRKIGAFDG